MLAVLLFWAGGSSVSGGCASSETQADSTDDSRLTEDAEIAPDIAEDDIPAEDRACVDDCLRQNMARAEAWEHIVYSCRMECELKRQKQ